MLNKVLRVVTALPGVLFLVMGVRWVIDPGGAAHELGMVLLDGIGLSSQIADMAAFFLTMGSLILMGVMTRKAFWFYAPVMMLGLAAIVRIVAWLVHGAELAAALIAVEVVIAVLLAVASVRICDESRS